LKLGGFVIALETQRMNVATARFTYWREDDGKYLGYLNEFPDHWTQGESLEDLKAHLRDLWELFSDEDLAGVRRESELEFA